MRNLLLGAAALALFSGGGCRWFHDCGCGEAQAYAEPAPPYYSPPPGAAPHGTPAPVFVQPGEPTGTYVPPPTLVP